MFTVPSIVAFVMLAIAIVKWYKGMRDGTREYIEHKAAHHHIVMMNEEVARRWRERQLNQESE